MARPRKSLDGTRFGRLTAISRGAKIYSKRTGRDMKQYWYLCRCDCGNEITVRYQHLTSGDTKSCGCLRQEHCAVVGKNCRTHGLKDTSTYGSWENMKARCQNKNFPSYKYYGEKGIRVCRRWQKFENFLADMGEKPIDGWHIDRINHLGDYEPTNCQWLSPSENSKRAWVDRRMLQP